jgi:hypothetical protein
MTEENENPIDKIIRQAREAGAFDDLPGKGKPIHWQDDSLVPEDQRMAQRVLRENGYTLDFIVQGRALEEEYAALRSKLNMARRARAEHRLDLAGWQSAVVAFQGQVRALNQRVIGYNMRVPSAQLERRPFSTDPDKE